MLSSQMPIIEKCSSIEMTSRRQFKGALTKKDESEADRAAVATINARVAQPKRQKTSDEVWGEKQLQFTATPTAHEKSLKEAAELCDAGRVLAVLDERKFPGQTNNVTKFYNNLTLVDLSSVLHQNFPILVGIAARIKFDISATKKKKKGRGSSLTLRPCSQYFRFLQVGSWCPISTKGNSST